MSVIALAEVRLQPGKAPEFIELLRSMIDDTRRAVGFEDISVHVDPEVEDSVFLIEQWRERADYQAYLDWRASIGDRETLFALMSEAPSVRYLELVDL